MEGVDLSILSELTGEGSPINTVDLFIILYLFYGLIRGLFRGLVAEFAGMFGSILAFFIGWKGYRPASDFVMAHTRLEDPIMARLVGYLILVCLFMAVWNLAVLLIRKTADLAFGKRLERLGGMLMGTAKCAIISCVILMAMGLSGNSLLERHFIEESWFGQTTQEWLPEKLHHVLPGVFDAPEPRATEDEDGEADPEAGPAPTQSDTA